jgi:hypothetical protein
MPAWPEDKFHAGFCTERYLTYGIYMAVLLNIVPKCMGSHGATGVGDPAGGSKPKPQSLNL